VFKIAAYHPDAVVTR